MLCLNCKKEFEAKRVSARYCSPKCRKLAFLSVPKDSVPVSVLPVSEVSVPEPAIVEKTCKCEEVEHSKDCIACERAIKAGKKNCGQKYFICGKHQTHIEDYCQAMCA